MFMVIENLEFITMRPSMIQGGGSNKGNPCDPKRYNHCDRKASAYGRIYGVAAGTYLAEILSDVQTAAIVSGHKMGAAVTYKLSARAVG
jgi:hypothetical protein